METPATTIYVKKLIHVPADYENAAYRQMIYDRWQAEWAAAQAQLDNINDSPFYGQGWRVD